MLSNRATKQKDTLVSGKKTDPVGFFLGHFFVPGRWDWAIFLAHRLGLVQATQWADFAVITDQL